MTAVLTHYVKVNSIRTISYSIRTDNSSCVQIYCIATYKITTTKEGPKKRISLLLQNILADGHTMFRFPVIRKKKTHSTLTHDLMGNIKLYS
jgi:hypothetical protein